MLSQVLAQLFKTVEERVLPLWTMNAAVEVVFSTVTSIEPPDVGTVAVSPSLYGVQARPLVIDCGDVAISTPGIPWSIHVFFIIRVAL